MKKNALFLGLFVFTFFACEKEESEHDRLRSNIVGEWIINSTGQEIRADTVYREFVGLAEATFNADGTGSKRIKHIILGTDTTLQFNWYFQRSPQQVTIILEPSESEFPPKPNEPVFVDTSQVYDVYKNEPDRQIWGYEQRFFLSSDVDAILWTWKMERK